MDETIAFSARIIEAYIARNEVPMAHLPHLIATVRHAIELPLSQTEPSAQPAKEPAVPIKKSVTPDYLICLEDGVKLKSLKRHLRAKYNLTPDQYRAKWGLPRDYPMVSPNYSAARSELARAMGLGRK